MQSADYTLIIWAALAAAAVFEGIRYRRKNAPDARGQSIASGDKLQPYQVLFNIVAIPILLMLAAVVLLIFFPAEQWSTLGFWLAIAVFISWVFQKLSGA